ncbi:MAG: hypothetical protein ABI190_00050 [Casimicrobiaceae bacterium]
MRLYRALLVAPFVLLTASCQTWGPTWSEISGSRYNVAILNRQPAVIESVDGNSAFPSRPIKLEPGHHEITITGVSQRPRAGGGELQKIALDVQPCKLYYINAQYASPVSVDYAPVVDYVDTIPGCRVPAK